MSESFTSNLNPNPNSINDEQNISSSDDQSTNNYYPYTDDTRPICRHFVNQGRCRRGNKCNFYHPEVICPIIQKKANRKLGHCFCGSPQRRLINNRSHRAGEYDDVIFFVVCSRTGRSMRYCM